MLENNTKKRFNHKATDGDILLQLVFLDTRGEAWIGDYIFNFNKGPWKSIYPNQSVKMKSYFQLRAIDGYFNLFKEEKIEDLSGDLYLSNSSGELFFNKVHLKNIEVCG